ncbi:hypothetical protein CW665_11565 [Macrococcoides caseolyticum]|uniref:hypothetical protein n=1 Tax=Macrococcoides caseolyticum TaxID=69966 RepID=UPI000C3397E5|nr:hypothetical protein [Macrococcus caseolyticus]PKE71232.1 hypothetical protein CW665_11565 [Macrococcus caseolyticus]
MNKVLFEVPRIVSEQEVKDKINYFVAKAEKASKIFEYDKSVGKLLAKELRDELKEEHRNNDKVETEKFYSKHSLFRNYKSVVHESFAKTVGTLDQGQKTRSFLYDVQDYMRHHFE